MDRYDRDERPSIFPQSEDELDEAQPATPESLATYGDRQDAASTRWIGRDSEAPADGPSRRFMVAIAAGGILIIGLIGYVGASVLRNAGDPGQAAASGSLTASASPSTTPSPSPSPTPLAAVPSSIPGPSPTLRPQPATPLLAGQWATVVTDLVNLRSTPRLVASVVGQAGRGEIVFVLASEAPVEVDGFTWYQVVADPNEFGWVAGHGPTEQLLRSDAPTVAIGWCGLVTEAVYATGDPAVDVDAVVAGLPVPVSALGRGASAALELMYGAQKPACVSLTIDAGTTMAATVDLEESVCALPWFGAMANYLAIGERFFQLDDEILGTRYADGVLANIEDVMTVGGVSENEDKRSVCVDYLARGGGDDITIETTATTDGCVNITEISATTVGIADPEGIWTVELERTAGSVVAESLAVGGPTAVRLSAQMGPEGAFSLQPATIAGC